MPMQTILWPLKPHTRAKHEILRRYLQAWQAILTQGGFPALAYIDGFAGPGRYVGGEDGSPIIALKSALSLHGRHARIPRLLFLFVERRQRHADALTAAVRQLSLPSNIRVKVARGQTFVEAFTEFRAFYERKNRALPATFAFVDPFGWTGAPLDIIQSILRHKSCEVLVNFSYKWINRFVRRPDQHDNFDALFGTGEWRAALGMQIPSERNRFLHDLYERQLQTYGGARYVRSFQMKNNNDATDYYLFYGTNSLTGLTKMKEAMWRVDQSGGFTFSDATDPGQLVLFDPSPTFDVLQRQILAEFRGRRTTVAAVEEFVLAHTAFRETHYKRVLRTLELAALPALVPVAPPAGRRRGTFGDPNMTIEVLG